MAKKKRTRRTRTGCKSERVSFKPKRGSNRGEKISFTRHVGPGCGKPKRSTAHLREYKNIVKRAAPSCGRRFGYFNKAYGRCIRDAIRTETPRRR